MSHPGEVAALLDATRRAEQQHFWWRGLRQFVRPLLEQATHGVAAPRLLDVGCGTGANLCLLSSFGRAHGLDITWCGLTHAKAYGQNAIVQASAALVPFPDAQFNVVTAFDVLYALDELTERAALEESLRVLRPGGYLIANVAALRILRGHHAEFGRELRRSSRRRLRRLLVSAGFEVERLTYTNASLFPLALVLRTAQRLTRRPLVEDIAVPPGPINELLSAMLTMEARALRWTDMTIGSSLLCLARKPITASEEGLLTLEPRLLESVAIPI
jgi:ubiquinone/menaquinone biosynthesis C-methylase UbiE